MDERKVMAKIDPKRPSIEQRLKNVNTEFMIQSIEVDLLKEKIELLTKSLIDIKSLVSFSTNDYEELRVQNFDKFSIHNLDDVNVIIRKALEKVLHGEKSK